MAERGRKSAASLSVVQAFPDPRPQPPEELTSLQASEWRAVVARMEPNWFTRETHPLLVSFCKHVVTAGCLATRIEALELALTDEDVGLYDKLLAMREREVRAMSSLATRMRLTQQSRYNALSANTAAKAGSGAASTAKPWNAAG